MLITSSRVRLTLAALLLTTTLAAGCGETAGDGNAAAQFERELEAMAGVADARVEREAFDTDYWGEEIVVDMDGDTTAAEVTAVLDAFLGRRQETDGSPQDSRLTIGAGTTQTQGDHFAPEAPPQAVETERPAGNARIGRLLVAAVAAFPDHFVSVLPGTWMVIGRADGTDPRPELDRMIDIVLSDDVLAAAKGLDLTAVAGPDDDRRTASLGAYRAVTPELVATWREFAPRLDDRVFRGVSFWPTSIHLDLRVGDNVKPRQLTTEAYGDLLWPTLHAALDTIATMPSGSTMRVVNQYGSEGHLEDRFLTTRPKLRTGRDRLGRTWNAEAAAYLDQAVG